MNSSNASTLHSIESRKALGRAALAVHWKYGKTHRLIMRIVEGLLKPLVWFLRTGPPPTLDQVRNILVLEQGHLGDVVQLTPFLQSLRRRFPDAHIAVAGRPSLRGLLEVQNLADELVSLQFPWSQWLPRWKIYNPFSSLVLGFLRDILRLRRQRFDMAFVSGLGEIRVNFALFLTGARRRIGYGFAGGALFLTDVVEPDLSRMQRFTLSLRLLEYIGIPVTSSRELLSLAPEDAVFGRDFLAKNGIVESDTVVGIHPGAGYAIKEWGEDHFWELAHRIVSRLGAKVVWFADPGRSSGKFGENTKDIVLATLPLRQFLAVLASCDAFVGNDSGPMHMAAGLAVPVIAIFGPELPQWFGPLGTGHEIVERKGMWCRPCWRKCRFAEHYCLSLISVEEVMQAVCTVLRRVAPGRSVEEATL